MISSDTASVALKADGSVTTFGASGGGGDSTTVADLLLSGVTSVSSTASAFSALKGGLCRDLGLWQLRRGVVHGLGSLGIGCRGHSLKRVCFCCVEKRPERCCLGEHRLRRQNDDCFERAGVARHGHLRHKGAFCALKNDSSALSWGSSNQGGDSSTVSTRWDRVLRPSSRRNWRLRH